MALNPLACLELSVSLSFSSFLSGTTGGHGAVLTHSWHVGAAGPRHTRRETTLGEPQTSLSRVDSDTEMLDNKCDTVIINSIC